MSVERKWPITARVRRLREELLASPNGLCVERARYLTDYMKRPEANFEHPLVRRAKAVSHILNNLSVKIYQDELIVGAIAEKRPGAIIYPEFVGLLIWPELDTISTREINPLELSEEERRELDEEIFPFWRGRTLADYTQRFYSPPKPIELLGHFGFFILTEVAGISHVAPNYERILATGLSSIKKQAEERIKELDESTDPDRLKKRPFYQAVVIASQSLVDFAERYACEAERLSAEEEDPKRRVELEEIARVCRRVPSHPARTFREALQFIWFVQIALHQENYEQGISPGRMDQYLYPYYKRDIEEGTLTPEEAVELIQCLWIKMSELIPLFTENLTVFFGGLPTNQAVTIGGVDREGEDATNELTYLMLEATAGVKLRQPNLLARLHRGSPEEYRDMVSEVIKTGGGMPALFNDDVIIPALIKSGVEEKDARDYCIIGCVELTAQGKTFGSTDAALMSLPICLEMALNDGYSTVALKQVGPHTGDPREFKTMEEVIEAYRKQLSFVVKQMVAGLNAIGLAHQEIAPSPLLSIMVDGCLERGEDITLGSAIYNSTGVQGVGLADVADSLAAIDKLIFRERAITWEELLQALADDFEGHERLHAMIMRSVPKYGNDDDFADEYARLVAEMYCLEVMKHTNPRFGRYLPGFYSMTCHNGFGAFVGALPSGRRAFQTFANGVTPYDGWDKKGPTATMKSVAKLDYSLVTNGCALNQKFDPKVLEGRRGTRNLSALTKAYFELGGMHVQYNVVGREILLDAKEHPEKYPGLMVRISGYSAYFADLTPDLQDEIINRTEQALGG